MRRRTHPESEGTVPGDVEAVSTGKAGDAYVMIRKRHDQSEDVEDENSE
jgi:hypothetical protein